MKHDLTKIGHDENILFEILNKDRLLKEKFPEAEIVDAPPLEEPPLPRYQREKVNYWQMLSAFNLTRYLP